MIIENNGKIVKLIAEEGKRITNKERTFFVEFMYLSKKDSAEHYIEVGKEIWGNFIKDPNVENRLDGVDQAIIDIGEGQEFQDIAIDTTMIALTETVDMVLDIIDGLLGGMVRQQLATMDIKDENLSNISKYPMKGGERSMVDFYVVAIQRGLKTIDDVPARYKKQVEAVLAAIEG